MLYDSCDIKSKSKYEIFHGGLTISTSTSLNTNSLYIKNTRETKFNVTDAKS